jgi:hypothetical protein
MPRFDPESMLRVLEAHSVDKVFIGGLVATLHGSPPKTGDADICPETKLDDLQRLAAVLVEVEAIVRSVDAPGGTPSVAAPSFSGTRSY